MNGSDGSGIEFIMASCLGVGPLRLHSGHGEENGGDQKHGADK
jgi:hypothetical protein